MNIGVVGVGRWGSLVLSKYRQLEQRGFVDKVYTCDKKTVGVDFKDYHSLYGRVDGVHICLPNSLHYHVVDDFLRHNVHVLVEKPITLSSVEAFKLVELASEMGLILQVGHVMRFDNTIRETRRLYQSGVWGGVVDVVVFWTDNRLEHKGNIVWDLLPHPLDILEFVFDRHPYRFFVDDRDVLAFLFFDYGFPVFVNLSWRYHEKHRLLVFNCSEGVFHVECNGMTVNGEKVVANDAITDEVRNFVGSVGNGRSCFNSHIVGARNVELIERILERGRESYGYVLQQVRKIG